MRGSKSKQLREIKKHFITVYSFWTIVSLFSLSFFACAPTEGEKPKPVIHRVQDTTKDPSGWYYAKSTEGHFSVLMPIPFNDFTMVLNDTIDRAVYMYMVGGKSDEGVKFSASEIYRDGRDSIVDLDNILSDFNQYPNQLTNIVKRENDISFDVKNSTSGASMRYVSTRTSAFALIIEYPLQWQGNIEDYRESFLNSLTVY